MTSISKIAVAVEKELQTNDQRYRIVPGHTHCRKRKRTSCKKKSTTIKRKGRNEENNLGHHSEVEHAESGGNFCETEQKVDAPIFSYSQLLYQSGGLSVCSSDGTAAVVQDVDITCSTLKNNYFVVERKTVGEKTIFFCGCSPKRSKLAKAADSVLNVEAFDEESNTSVCIHCQVWQYMIPSCMNETGPTDDNSNRHDHHYSMKPDDVHFYEIPSNELFLVVHAESMYGILEINNTRGLQCHACRYQNCPHSKALLATTGTNAVVDNFKEFINLQPKFRDRYVPKCVSTEKISFEYLQPKSSSHKIPSELSPDSSGHCECGSVWGNTINPVETVLFTLESTIPVTVYDRECTSCDQVKDFDGGSYGILNMGSYLIEHIIYRRYTKQFLTDGTTLSSFYKQLVWDHLEKGDLSFSDRFTGYRFRNGWYSFLSLMDINFAEGFMCPMCGPQPDLVIMDGVTLGIKKSNMVYSVPTTAETNQLDGSTRVLIKNNQTRRLLKTYATKGLSHPDFIHLQKLATLYCPFLSPLLSHFFENGSSSKCPKQFASFLCSLSSDYPLLSLIHSDSVCTILEKEGTGGNFRKSVFDMAILEENCPSVFHLLSSFDETPDFISVILSSVVDNVRQLLDAKPHDLEAADEGDKKNCRKCFPSMPQLFKRGRYVLDNKNKDFLACKKNSSTHRSLTPGLFTMSCCHGVCYGFSLMESSESPDVPFTLLRTHFRKAPKVVVYDNACNLNQYCLNRDPGFFSRTWFVVDRFHWPNHTACHEGFNLSMYDQHRTLNSQVAEQRNSTFKKIKPMLSYMSLENFISHCKLYVWFRNMISIVTHQPLVNLEFSDLFKKLSKVYSS